MIIRLVQTYGQIRLGNGLALPLGLLATLSLELGEDEKPCGIVVAPYRAGDEVEPGHDVIKLTNTRLTIPVKLRRLVGIERYVQLFPLAGGKVLIRPVVDIGKHQ